MGVDWLETARVMLRQWRQAWESTAKARDRWRQFETRFERRGADLACSALLLWCQIKKLSGREGEGLASVAEDARMLKEILASVPPEGPLVEGWLRALRKRRSDPESLELLHREFGGALLSREVFWQALNRAFEADRADKSGQMLEAFRSLDVKCLYEFYYRNPGRAVALTKAAGDDELELLQKAGARKAGNWSQEAAEATLKACFKVTKGKALSRAPAALGEFHEHFAKSWIALLAQHRLTKALTTLSPDDWGAVPCALADVWKPAYESSLVRAALVTIEQMPGALRWLPKYLLDKLCEAPETRKKVIETLLAGLARKQLSWGALGEDLSRCIQGQVERDASALFSGSLVESIRRDEITSAELPGPIRSRLIQKAVETAEKEPQLTDDGTRRVQETLGRVLSSGEPRKDGAPWTGKGSDWFYLVEGFDPEAAESAALVPARSAEAVVVPLAVMVYGRWRMPGSASVSVEAAVEDIAKWSDDLLRQRQRAFALVVSPLFEGRAMGEEALEAFRRKPAACAKLRVLVTSCLAEGAWVGGGLLAASCSAAAELADWIDQMARPGDGGNIRSREAGRALAFWCRRPDVGDDFAALAGCLRGMTAAGAAPEESAVDALFKLACAERLEAGEVRDRALAAGEAAALGAPDVGRRLLRSLREWSETTDPEKLAGLWPVMEQEAGRFGPEDADLGAVVEAGFRRASSVKGAAGWGNAERLVQEARKLRDVFHLPDDRVLACAREAALVRLEGSPSEDQFCTLLRGLRDLLVPAEGSGLHEEFRRLEGEMFGRLGERDPKVLLLAAAREGLPWEALLSFQRERLTRFLREIPVDEILDLAARMAPGEVRAGVGTAYAELADPCVYEDLCVRQACAQQAEAEEWAARFLATKARQLRGASQPAAAGRHRAGEPGRQKEAREGLEASWRTLDAFVSTGRLDVVDADLCGALAGRFLAGVKSAKEGHLHLADLLLLIWAEGWSAADAGEPAAAWGRVWREGLGEALAGIFGSKSWGQDAECRRRAFACELIGSLLEASPPPERSLGEMFARYGATAKEMGFGAPVYVDDVQGMMESRLRNFRVSVLRRIVEDDTNVRLGPQEKGLLRKHLDAVFRAMHGTCVLTETGVDPFRARIFLPGDPLRPGGGVVEMARERGAGLPEELAVVLLLRAWEEGRIQQAGHVLGLLEQILRLDLDLANASIGGLLRGLVESAFVELSGERHEGIARQLLGLRWRTGFGARAGEREEALLKRPKGWEEEEPTWALCARIGWIAYEAFEQSHSQTREDELRQVMHDCEVRLESTGGEGPEEVLLRRVALRVGLEALSWMSARSDTSDCARCLVESNRNPFVGREEFEAHLQSLGGAARGAGQGRTFVLWRGYNDDRDPRTGELKSGKVSETDNFGTTILVKVRDHKWRARLLKYHVQPSAGTTRHLSIARLHTYRLYLERIRPYLRVGRHLLHVDTLAPLHLFGLPASDLPSKSAPLVDIGKGDLIRDVSAWQMPCTVAEYLGGESVLETFCDLMDNTDLSVRQLIVTVWPDPEVRSRLTGEEAHGRILRWCDYFWGMQRETLMDIARQLNRLVEAMAMMNIVSLDFKPQHVLLCRGSRGESHPVLIDLDALFVPGTEITVLNRSIEQSPYREPEYSAFLAAARKASSLSPLQAPTDSLPFRFTPRANYYVAQLMLYELLAMTPGLQAAPVDVPDYFSEEKRRIMDALLGDVTGPGAPEAGETPQRIRSLEKTAEMILGDWPDLSSSADVSGELEKVGVPNCTDLAEQLAFVDRLVRNAVDPPAKGAASHPPWGYAVVPVSWVGGLEGLSKVSGYDVLFVILRLFAEGVTDVDAGLVLGPETRVPGREDREALREFHRRCSRFYVSIGGGERDFWRRSRGQMLERSLLKAGDGVERLLENDVIVTFGWRERTSRRQRVGRELATINFALRFAPVPDIFMQSALRGERGEPALTVRPARPEGGKATWKALAEDLAYNVVLERIFSRANIDEDMFLRDPAALSFALGTAAEPVALGKPDGGKVLTHRGLEPGWVGSLDLTPYLPGGQGGPVYVRVRTTPFMFRVAWD